MAAVVYYQWVGLGRPLEPARPVRDIVERMKLAYPKAAGTFSWYANEAHYTAVPPQDHTPYSSTGWPVESPQWWVFATDIMHRPDLGVDCSVLFAYWLGEAKAGRMPWCKYLIWQAQLYDVRNAWKPQANSGHFDHIHISARTDYRDRGLGSWSLIPGGDDDMDVNQSAELAAIFNAADVAKLDTNGDGKADQDFPVGLTKLLKGIDHKLSSPLPVTVTVDPAVLAAALAAALKDPAVRAILVDAAKDGANLAEDS